MNMQKLCSVSFSGLVFKKMENYEEALDCFMKLHSILRNNPQVIWQLANMYPLLTNCLEHTKKIFSFYCFPSPISPSFAKMDSIFVDLN